MQIDYTRLFSALDMEPPDEHRNMVCKLCGVIPKSMKMITHADHTTFVCHMCGFRGGPVELIASILRVTPESARSMLSEGGRLAQCVMEQQPQKEYNFTRRLAQLPVDVCPVRDKARRLSNTWVTRSGMNPMYMPDDMRFVPRNSLPNTFRLSTCNAEEDGVAFIYRCDGLPVGFDLVGLDTLVKHNRPSHEITAVFPEPDALAAPGGITIVTSTPEAACKLISSFRSVTGGSLRIFHARTAGRIPKTLYPSHKLVLWCPQRSQWNLADAIAWLGVGAKEAYVATSEYENEQLETIVRAIDSNEITLRDWIISRLIEIHEEGGPGSVATAVQGLLTAEAVATGCDKLITPLLEDAGLDVSSILTADQSKIFVEDQKKHLLLTDDGVYVLCHDLMVQASDKKLDILYAYTNTNSTEDKIHGYAVKITNADGSVKYKTVGDSQIANTLRSVVNMNAELVVPRMKPHTIQDILKEFRTLAREKPVISKPAPMSLEQTGFFTMPGCLIGKDGNVSSFRLVNIEPAHACYRNIDHTCTRGIGELRAALCDGSLEEIVLAGFIAYIRASVHYGMQPHIVPNGLLSFIHETPEILDQIAYALQHALSGDANSHYNLGITIHRQVPHVGHMPIIMDPTKLMHGHTRNGINRFYLSRRKTTVAMLSEDYVICAANLGIDTIGIYLPTDKAIDTTKLADKCNIIRECIPAVIHNAMATTDKHTSMMAAMQESVAVLFSNNAIAKTITKSLKRVNPMEQIPDAKFVPSPRLRMTRSA